MGNSCAASNIISSNSALVLLPFSKIFPITHCSYIPNRVHKWLHCLAVLQPSFQVPCNSLSLPWYALLQHDIMWPWFYLPITTDLQLIIKTHSNPPRTRLMRYRPRSFAVSSPVLWNSLPAAVVLIHQRHRQMDRQTTCDRKTVLCTVVQRAVRNHLRSAGHIIQLHPSAIATVLSTPHQYIAYFVHYPLVIALKPPVISLHHCRVVARMHSLAMVNHNGMQVVLNL